MTDDISRGIFVCQDCGRHYLPPADMQYPCGPASEIFCATCQPLNSPALAAQHGVNLADNMIKPRSRGPRRAGNAPAARGKTGRSKLG
ncbi:hypothetical protein [Streptacidiphilus cavernicola]|uniref:Zinc ribbon domain-containing protein n=1 Tax=Streptacidiphilus cavernicola TaxID=3342716 RepID=A0ABV6VYD1_9ACTN